MLAESGPDNSESLNKIPTVDSAFVPIVDGAGDDCQTACKPGSVRTQVALECVTTIPLGRALRRASRDQPGRRSGNAPASCDAAAPIRSCSRWGLPCRPCCQGRGALLPHRFALARGLPCGACAGGLFSVALSLGSSPPAVSRHRVPVEPGLSSARKQRPSGRLAGRDMPGNVQESKSAPMQSVEQPLTPPFGRSP